VMALDAIGDSARAHEQFAAMHHLREEDGSYWTGLVYADGKRWPVERTTWTGAAMILAADALSSTTAASGIFRGEDEMTFKERQQHFGRLFVAGQERFVMAAGEQREFSPRCSLCRSDRGL